MYGSLGLNSLIGFIAVCFLSVTAKIIADFPHTPKILVHGIVPLLKDAMERISVVHVKPQDVE